LPPAPKEINGVDLGCIHEQDSQRIAAVDDGRIYTSTDHLKRNTRRHKTLQKLASPKRRTRGTAKAADPNSKRTAKRQARIARLHQRTARQREHTLQYTARRLIDTATRRHSRMLIGVPCDERARHASRATPGAAPGKPSAA
jgi:hypothetical protein